MATTRRRRGSSERVVANTVPERVDGRRVTVLDPACGDGRFLLAAARRLRAAGAALDDVTLVGMDIDAAAVAAARRALAESPDCLDRNCRVARGDALAHDWAGDPLRRGRRQPALPLAARRRPRRAAGPAATAAVRTPTSPPSSWPSPGASCDRPADASGSCSRSRSCRSRDAAAVRAELDRRATITWSWWSPTHVFDAQVHVCAIAFEARPTALDVAPGQGSWSHVVTDALGVPAVPDAGDGRARSATRARLTANFRDQYYGLVPAVVEDGDGPPLVTSGLVDPARCALGSA